MGSKKPYFAVILIQVSFAGMNLLSKAAFADGLSPYVLLFYRQAAGTIFLIPLTLYWERKALTPLSFVSCFKISMLAFLGITFGLNTYGVGVDFTSATLGATAFNCLPITTFFFAFLLGMEKASLKTASGIAKVAGIVICLAGAATLTFYTGPYLKPFFHNHFFEFHLQPRSSSSSTERWIIGCLLLFLSSSSWGLWLVLQDTHSKIDRIMKKQARFLKSYPSTLAFTTLQIASSVVQTFVVAIAMERDPAKWKLGFNVRLLAVVYCAIFVSCFSNIMINWVMKEKGPVFQAVTTPLNLVITILGSLLFLNESVSLGSILGAVILVASLYSVLWGKSKDGSLIQTQHSSLQSEREEENSHEESEVVGQV